MNYQLQASLDGFTTAPIELASFNYFGRTSGTAPAVDPLLENPFFYMTNDLSGRPNTTTSPGDAIPTVNLAAFSELQDLSGGSEVLFRLYAWGNDATALSNTVALGRMVGPSIGGTVVAVPEPTSAGYWLQHSGLDLSEGFVANAQEIPSHVVETISPVSLRSL
jgi:hypothetical protein